MQSSLPARGADDAIESLIRHHREQPGGLLPLLHAIQEARGHVPAGAVDDIARGMGLSRAEVHGVLTYYHFFRQEPAGRHVVQVCRAEACQSCGAEELLAQAQEWLGCAAHATREDGGVTLEPVYCLGLCASAPAMQVDGRLHARVTPARLRQLVDGLEAGS